MIGISIESRKCIIIPLLSSPTSIPRPLKPVITDLLDVVPRVFGGPRAASVELVTAAAGGVHPSRFVHWWATPYSMGG